MAYDARSVANEFLRQVRERGGKLTNMQLQKLVYIAHGYSLAILHRPLIKQPIEAWRFGPVVHDLYYSLRQYGAGFVTEPINNLPNEQVSETDRELIASVLNAYGKYSGLQLSTMTHRQDTPWHEVFTPAGLVHSNEIIDNKLIEAHYTGLLNERAGIAPN
jgi:uncharacterized phage-associated protein